MQPQSVGAWAFVTILTSIVTGACTLGGAYISGHLSTENVKREIENVNRELQSERETNARLRADIAKFRSKAFHQEGSEIAELRLEIENVRSDNSKLKIENDQLEVQRVGKESQPPNTGPEQTRVVDDTRFDLYGCRSKQSAVLCEFIITKLDKDAELTVWSNSRFFDPEGQEHYTNWASILSEKVAMTKRGAYNSRVTARLSKGVSAKAAMSFPEVPSYVKKMVSLEVAADKYVVKFPDVAIR